MTFDVSYKHTIPPLGVQTQEEAEVILLYKRVTDHMNHFGPQLSLEQLQDFLKDGHVISFLSSSMLERQQTYHFSSAKRLDLLIDLM